MPRLSAVGISGLQAGDDVKQFTPQIAAIKREFRDRGAALFGRAGTGHGWQAALARAYGIGDRRVREYVAEPPAHWMPVPSWLLTALRDGVMARREITIVGPEPGSSAGADRAESLYRAIAPALDTLVQAAVDAGWHPADVTTAVQNRLVDIIGAQSIAAPARKK